MRILPLSDEWKAVFANLSWLTLQRILMSALNLITMIVVVRYLGPKQFGMLNYAQALLAVFSFLTLLGLNSIVVKCLVNASEKKRQLLLGSAFFLILCGGVITTLCIAVIAGFSASSLQNQLIIILVGISCIFQAFNVIDYYFQSIVKSKFFVIAQFVQMLISITFRLLLVCWHASIIWFAVALVFDAALLAINLVIMYQWQVSSLLRWRISWSAMMYLFKQSWPLMFSTLAISVYMRIDQVMVQSFLGSKAVGWYAAAVKITEFWYFIPMLISQSILPMLTRLHKTNHEKFLRVMRYYYAATTWGAVAIAFLVTLCSSMIIHSIYGVAYVESAQVLSISMWGGVFVFIGVATSNYFLVHGQQKFMMWRTIVGAIVNVVCNFYLIPHFGLVGAAISTVFAYACAGYFFMIVHRNARVNFLLVTRAVCFFPISR